MTKQQKNIKVEWALKIFRTAVLVYADYLGLKDWEWEIGSERGEDYRARSESEQNGRMAEVYLSESWIRNSNPSSEEIKITAFHEVVEILLSPLRAMGEKEFTYCKVDKEIHKIIRVLENTLFKEINKNAKDN